MPCGSAGHDAEAVQDPSNGRVCRSAGLVTEDNVDLEETPSLAKADPVARAEAPGVDEVWEDEVSRAAREAFRCGRGVPKASVIPTEDEGASRWQPIENLLGLTPVRPVVSGGQWERGYGQQLAGSGDGRQLVRGGIPGSRIGDAYAIALERVPRCSDNSYRRGGKEREELHADDLRPPRAQESGVCEPPRMTAHPLSRTF